MSLLKWFLLLNLLFTSSVEAAVDFKRLKDGVEKASAIKPNEPKPSTSPPRTYQIIEDKQIVEAERQRVIERINNSKLLSSHEVYVIKQESDIRQRNFEWQLLSSQLIFGVFVIFVLCGLYFSYLQFTAKKMPTANNSNLPNPPEAPIVSQLDISATGVKVSSPVIGLLILVLSLVLFYIYVKEVYPLRTEETGTTTVEKTPDKPTAPTAQEEKKVN